MQTLICSGCMRKVDELKEILVIDDGVMVKAVRCDNCMGIAMDKIKILQNYRMN